jgi:hypothetical protein
LVLRRSFDPSSVGDCDRSGGFNPRNQNKPEEKMSGEIVLSFHDAIVYSEDLKILKKETEWLNDRIISFYFEYLSKEVYEDEKILFVGKTILTQLNEI